MITGRQIKAARALLDWSAEETANRAKIARKTVERLEQSQGQPAARALTIFSLQTAFEAAGIEFLGTAEEGPGVRLWPPKRGRVKAGGPAPR